MLVYIHNGAVRAFVQEEDPVFPGIPIEERYSADFVAHLVPVPDGVEVKQGDVYDPETGSFTTPEPPELPAEEYFPVDAEPTEEQPLTPLQRLAALEVASAQQDEAILGLYEAAMAQ